MSNVGPRLYTPEPEVDDQEVEVEFFDPETNSSDVIDVGIDGLDEVGHYDNLVEFLEDDEVATISSDVIADFETDKESRSDWADAYVRGLNLLGLKIEERSDPWPGASGVFHPILMESIIRFQAQAMGELFPAQGPARTKIPGKATKEKLEQAQRIEREINYQLTEKMVEYREETEQQLFHLPMAGSAFKKVYYDPVTGMPCAQFVPAEDLVVSQGATNLERADRFTHVMLKSKSEIDELMFVNFYADCDLTESANQPSDIQEAYDKLSGEESFSTRDNRLVILEQHCLLRLFDDEMPSPYIVTVEKSSGKLLAVRRNWSQDDKIRQRRMHFVHYKYLPGLGFYGIGLIHLLGGLTKTATSILRQLIDAGTLANLPAGFKTRGLRIKGDDTPFRPGEFRDVDVGSGKVADSIHFLPYKEPSSVLYQLLGEVVGEARRIGAVAETELTQLSGEMPVGTTFAILERQMKVLTGVQARLHASLKKELKIVSRIIGGNMSSRYEWDEEEIHDRIADFDSRVDVIPVSDPNASTTAQRVVSYQAAMQMAERAPTLYDMGKLHRQMLDVLQIDNADEILKLPEDIPPMDPVTENMAVLKQEPVRVFAYQDHEAHIQVHLAATQDPKIQQLVGQSPFAGAIQSAMMSHIAEHVAEKYRRDIEKRLGVELPDPKAPLPEDLENEVARLSSSAAAKLLADNQAEEAEAERKRQEEDPLTIIQREELKIKREENEWKRDAEFTRLQLEAVSKGANFQHMKDRLDSEEMRAAGNLMAKLATTPSADNQTLEAAIRIMLEQAKLMQQEGKIDKGENRTDYQMRNMGRTGNPPQ